MLLVVETIWSSLNIAKLNDLEKCKYFFICVVYLNYIVKSKKQRTTLFIFNEKIFKVGFKLKHRKLLFNKKDSIELRIIFEK